MRIGLVGYGAWGRMHAGAIARIPGLSLAAVMCGSDTRPVPLLQTFWGSRSIRTSRTPG